MTTCEIVSVAAGIAFPLIYVFREKIRLSLMSLTPALVSCTVVMRENSGFSESRAGQFHQTVLCSQDKQAASEPG